MRDKRSPLFGDRATVLDELIAHSRRSYAPAPFDATEAAYHEAGHVVVAHHLGIEIGAAEIGRRPDGNDGATWMRSPSSSLRSAKRMAPAYWAGLVAQSYALGRRSWVGTSADITQVAHSVPNAARHESLWFGAIATAAELLSDPRAWADVEAVASALLAHGRLDAPAVEALFSRPGRPS